MSGMERHLNAVIGYLELGMYLEALDEMERMQPEEKIVLLCLGCGWKSIAPHKNGR